MKASEVEIGVEYAAQSSRFDLIARVKVLAAPEHRHVRTRTGVQHETVLVRCQLISGHVVGYAARGVVAQHFGVLDVGGVLYVKPRHLVSTWQALADRERDAVTAAAAAEALREAEEVSRATARTRLAEIVPADVLPAWVTTTTLIGGRFEVTQLLTIVEAAIEQDRAGR